MVRAGEECAGALKYKALISWKSIVAGESRVHFKEKAANPHLLQPKLSTTVGHLYQTWWYQLRSKITKYIHLSSVPKCSLKVL